MTVDIHSHILPGVDDGADSIADALQMADIAAESGVEAMIITPHSYGFVGAEQELINKIDSGIKVLQNDIDAEGIPLKLYKGMEILVNKNTAHLLKNGSLLTLNESRYVLVEFDFSTSEDIIKRALFEIYREGFVPVLAHPERYDSVKRNPNLVYEVVSDGVLVQVNKSSLLGGFGRQIWELSNSLIEHGLVSFVASDAHSPYLRTTSMLKLRSYLIHMFSEDLCIELMEENPYALLNDKELHIGKIKGF